jgi:hypothetical protein
MTMTKTFPKQIYGLAGCRYVAEAGLTPPPSGAGIIAVQQHAGQTVLTLKSRGQGP